MGTSLVQKLVSGVPLWQPRKGHEFKSYRQLQAEAIEKRERENAVLRKHKGAWPGERAPSYSLFLWASGTELTPILDSDDKGGKFIPYNIRYVRRLITLPSFLGRCHPVVECRTSEKLSTVMLLHNVTVFHPAMTSSFGLNFFNDVQQYVQHFCGKPGDKLSANGNISHHGLLCAGKSWQRTFPGCGHGRCGKWSR